MGEMLVSALSLYASAALVCALAGLAALLRSERPLTVRLALVTLFNFALLGLGLGLLWAVYFADSPPALVGLVLLAGLGGQPTFELALEAARRFLPGGVGRKIKTPPADREDQPRESVEAPDGPSCASPPAEAGASDKTSDTATTELHDRLARLFAALKRIGAKP